MDSWNDFFNSSLGNQLTDIGTSLIKKELGLNKVQQNTTIIQPSTPVTTAPSSNSKTMLYVGLGAVALVAVFLIVRK